MPQSGTKTRIKMGDVWGLIAAVVECSPRVFLTGPPGTGKTYAANNAGLSNGQSVYTATLTDETPSAELRGFFVPSGGEFKWMDGPALLAWKNGGRLVLNEIDRASSDTLSFLLAVLDDEKSASMVLPDGSIVKPVQGFCCVATSNRSADALPEALRDRFPVKVEVNEVAPEALAALPADLQEVASKTVVMKQESRRIGMREWREYALLRTSLGVDTAARAVFGDRHKDILTALRVGRR